MVLRISGALTLILSTVGFLNATTPATFNVTEPLSVAGVPPVTLGPGTYVIRTVDSVGGTSFVQILSKKGLCLYDGVDDSGDTTESRRKISNPLFGGAVR